MSGDCPKGGNHNWRNTHETATEVTHTCSKCGQTYTRDKAKVMAWLTGAGWKLLAVLILAAALTPIWRVALRHP